MLLHARGLWYRVLCFKIPTGKYLHSIGRQESPSCAFCSHHTDDVYHFLVECPKKLTIWQATLGAFFLWLHFSSDTILQTLRALVIPFTIPMSLHQSYITMIATSQFIIWKTYWRLIFDKIPFDAEHVLTEVHTTFRTLSL